MTTPFAVPRQPNITVGETYKIHNDPTDEFVVVTAVWWRTSPPRAWFVDVLRLDGRTVTHNPGALYRPRETL